MSKFDPIASVVKQIFATDEFIPLHAPVFKGNERNYINDALDSTFVSSVGAYVNQFEEEIAKVSGTKKGVAVVNGTAGLQVALRLAGVQTNDEVLTQALSFVATANAIAYNNAHSVFIDVDLDTMGLSASALEAFLDEFGELREDGCYNKSTNRRIAACVPMHTFGFLCRMNEILAICEKWQIPVLEDAAESIGSEYYGKPSGSLGLMGVFSFNGNKIITAGGGGAIVSNNEKLAAHAKHLTTTAKTPHPWEYVHDELGYNFRMPNLNAALICGQLEQLNSFIENKTVLFEEYKSTFSKQGLQVKEVPDTTSRWNHWLMAVQLEDLSDRNDFLKTTNDAGVMTRPIWQLMHKLPMYSHCQRDGQQNASFLEERIVNIPSSVR